MWSVECEQNTPTRHIFSHVHALISMAHVTLAQGVLRTSSMCHPHVVVVLILFDPLLCTLHRLSHLHLHSPVLHLHLPCGVGSMRSPRRTSANEELGTLAENNPLTVYEPKFFDDYLVVKSVVVCRSC